MGRGRAKAKQTKVARELKYSSGNTDLTALERELASGSPGWGSPARAASVPAAVGAGNDLEEVDPYAPDDEDDEETGHTAAAR